MSATSSLAIVPLRGLLITDETVPANTFAREWTLVSPQSLLNLLSTYPHGYARLYCQRVVDRLWPDALMLVRCKNWQPPHYLEAYDRAATIAAGLSLARLIQPKRPRRQSWPLPIYITRLKEVCDLPLVINNERALLDGHSTFFDWTGAAQVETTISGWRCHTRDEIESLIDEAPSIVRRALTHETLADETERVLVNSLRAMNAALQATSVGQMCAQLISAAEVLAWGVAKSQGKRLRRVKALVGPEGWSRFEDVLAARHRFVHEAREPEMDQSYFGHCALALFVQAWMTATAYYPRAGGVRAAWKALDRLAQGFQSNERTPSGPRLAAVSAMLAGVPIVRFPNGHWIHQHLVPMHPNDYHQHYPYVH